MSAPDFGEEKRPVPDVSREELMALADECERYENNYPTAGLLRRVAVALRKAAPVEQEPVALKEATAAQHFDLPKGTPAKFVRNGILETCQCSDCRSLATPPAPSDAPGDAR